jgi:dihydrolipoamide dehydrogenase
MADNSFDVVVIGSGPGGYVTAIRAAQLGFKTAIVEGLSRRHLQQLGLHSDQGAAALGGNLSHMTHAKDYGLSADNVSFDPKAVIARSRAVVKRLNGGVEFLMKKNKISIIWGEATLDAPGKFTVKRSAAEAPKGSLGEGAYRQAHHRRHRCASARAAGLEPDKKLVWTYFEAMNPDKFPKSLLVVGSGAIGIEFASFYRTLGAEVTVVEVLPQILPVEDAEIAASPQAVREAGHQGDVGHQGDQARQENRQRCRHHR